MSVTALLFAAVVYPILCALENRPWFAGLFVQKGPGEVKKSLLLLFVMDAALVAVLLVLCFLTGLGSP